MMRYRGVLISEACEKYYRYYLAPLGFDFSSVDERGVLLSNGLCTIYTYMDISSEITTFLQKNDDPDKKASLIEVLTSLYPGQKWLTMFACTKTGRDVLSDIRKHYCLLFTHCKPLIDGDNNVWRNVWKYIDAERTLQIHIVELIHNSKDDDRSISELSEIIERYYIDGYYNKVWRILTELSHDIALSKNQKLLLKWCEYAMFSRWVPPPIEDLPIAVRWGYLWYLRYWGKGGKRGRSLF